MTWPLLTFAGILFLGSQGCGPARDFSDSGGTGGAGRGGTGGSTGGASASGGGVATGGAPNQTTGGAPADGGTQGDGGASGGDGGTATGGTGGGGGAPPACRDAESRSCSTIGTLGNCAAGKQTCTAEGEFGACSVQPASEDRCDIYDDADCDGTPNGGCVCTDGDTQPCGTTDVGLCEFGESVCSGEQYQACQGAVYPATRDCSSAADRDCDGKPDNQIDSVCECAIGTSQPCNAHPGYDGIGPCKAGMQTCVASADKSRSYWGACTGAVGPAAKDDCEGKNSDCSGSANDGCACQTGSASTCDTVYGSLGLCASVGLTCVAGSWPSKSTCTSAAQTENCSTPVDENCDGQANEAASCPCNSNPCSHGGQCNPTGGSGYDCDCSGTGYEGTQCTQALVRQLSVPSGASSCKVVGVADGGTVVLANCLTGNTMPDPFFWQSGSWAAAQRPSGYPIGWAVGLSANGTVAVGDVRDGNGVDNTIRWSPLTSTGVLLSNPTWTSAIAISSSGNAVISITPAGQYVRWSPLTASSYQTWSLYGATTVISGNGSILVSSGTSSGGTGYQIWTSETASTDYTLAVPTVPRFVNLDGTTIVSTTSGTDTLINRNGGFDSHSNCLPAGLSSDGRRVLAICGSTLRLFRDGIGIDVQQLIDDSGANFTISASSLADPQDLRLSYDGYYVGLSTSSNVVVIHLLQ